MTREPTYIPVEELEDFIVRPSPVEHPAIESDDVVKRPEYMLHKIPMTGGPRTIDELEIEHRELNMPMAAASDFYRAATDPNQKEALKEIRRITSDGSIILPNTKLTYFSLRFLNTIHFEIVEVDRLSDRTFWSVPLVPYEEATE